MNNSTYEILRDIGIPPVFFTEADREQLLVLEALLKSGDYGAEFPWELRDELLFKKHTTNLPADYKDLARERFLAFEKAVNLIHLAVSRNSSIPITPTNVDAVLAESEALKQKLESIPVVLEQLVQQAKIEEELFGYSDQQVPDVAPSPATLGLKWHAPRTEFVELIYALFEAGAITSIVPGGREGAVKRLGEALGVEGKTAPSTVIQDIKTKRNRDRLTPLLDRLKEKFLDYLSR